MQLTTDDIQNLILAGQTDKPSDELLKYFKHRDYVNRQHRDGWRKLISDTSDTDLIFIFKGLVNLERELKWLGGSVAGAIWVYSIIKNRGLDNDYHIADFGLRNSENPWIPFGSAYYGKLGERTASEYFANKREKARIKAIKADRYEKVLNRVEGRKEKRTAAIAELRKLTKQQRGELRTEFLAKYSNATTKEKLEVMANDNVFPPEYYPAEWISIPSEEIQELPIELVKKLYDKLSTKTKGQWKRFAHELQKLDDGI